jgi:O-antigen ligase
MTALVFVPRARPTRLWVAASVATAVSLVLLVYVLERDATRVRLSELAALFVALTAASNVIALRMPRFPLAAALAYAGSPLSFYIVFRHTSAAFAYPDARDLSVDAAITLGLLCGAIAPLVARAEFRAGTGRDRLLLPLGALSGAWFITALVGLARGNSPRYVVTDLIPVAEIVLAYVAASRLFTRPSQLRRFVLLATSSLAVTAVVRLAFYPFGTRGFGVTQQGIGAHILPRFFLVQPFAWLAPACAVYALTARTRRRRLVGAALVTLFGTCTLLSFERGTWVVLGCALLPVLGVLVWKRPRAAIAALAAAAVASIALAAVGKGSYNPITLVAHRLAYTRTQVFDPNEPLQNKRSDEARALVREIQDHPSYWPVGAGLGATYVGPTGFRDIGYKESFKPKHYSFNTYLAVALRSGLLGLVTLALLIVGMLRVAWLAARSTRARFLSLAGATVFGGTVALVGISIVDPEILIHPLALYLGATFGLLTRGLRWSESDKES